MKSEKRNNGVIASSIETSDASNSEKDKTVLADLETEFESESES